MSVTFSFFFVPVYTLLMVIVNITGVCKYLKGVSKDDRDKFFSVVCSERKGGNFNKLKCRKLHLNIRKKLFTVRIVKLWNRLSKEVVGSISLDILKT